MTIPSCWYLWPDTSHAESGHHGDHDEEHGEEHSEAAEEKSEAGPADDAEPEEPKELETGPVDEAKPETDGEQQDEEKKDEEKVESEEGGKGGPKQTGEVKKDDGSKPTKEEANSEEGAEVLKVQKDRTIRKPLPSSGQPLTKSPMEGGNEVSGPSPGGRLSLHPKLTCLSRTSLRVRVPAREANRPASPTRRPSTRSPSPTTRASRRSLRGSRTLPSRAAPWQSRGTIRLGASRE